VQQTPNRTAKTNSENHLRRDLVRNPRSSSEEEEEKKGFHTFLVLCDCLELLHLLQQMQDSSSRTLESAQQ
jgi:hypothetical protein